MNKCYFIGNLTRDPELSETNNGIAVCKFSIAVNRNFKNDDGEIVVDYFNIVAWRGLAETCGKYLSKGKKVAVIGSLQNRSYEDKEHIKRYATDIIASEVEFLSAKSGDSSQDSPKRGEPTQTRMNGTGAKPTLTPADDTLPF